MKPGSVDSHIQMPRFLLARFENECHSFFYYDVKKGFIGSNGHAKSMNTEHGYYPDEVEKLLSDEIEKPFSQVLKLKCTRDFGQLEFLTAPTVRTFRFRESPVIGQRIFKNPTFRTRRFVTAFHEECPILRTDGSLEP